MLHIRAGMEQGKQGEHVCMASCSNAAQLATVNNFPYRPNDATSFNTAKQLPVLNL
jgi:hypothetical protein